MRPESVVISDLHRDASRTLDRLTRDHRPALRADRRLLALGFGFGGGFAMCGGLP
jgi:predicted dienelactone hydrolase